MNDSDGEAPTRRETLAVLCVCALAALRVFAFSAAFPLFSNVDEPEHFDLVSKYARGHVPAGIERWDAAAARLVVQYSTAEYRHKPSEYPGGVYPPFHRILTPELRQALESEVRSWVQLDNYESTQPPVYYVMAGAWYRVGSALGLAGGRAVYWVRFLNVFVMALVTWLAYLVARSVFPNHPFRRLGVPILIAFIPQDAMYLVNNDVFLPLVSGAAFLCLMLLLPSARTGLAFHAGTGSLIAAALLVKFSSVAMLPVALGVVAFRIAAAGTGKERTKALVRGAALLVAAALPVAAWCLRSYLLFGDATGSLVKARHLGWTLKPVGGMLSHPIFTLSGMTLFWQTTLATFWRGEIVWGLRAIASPAWDVFYGVSSFIFIAVALVASWTWRRPARLHERSALVASAVLFLLSLAFLAVISIAYDFGDCFYPSRALPYVTSGRLAAGALIPFALLYVSGLDALLPRRLAAPVRWSILLVPIAIMTISEIVLSRTVFASDFNWFHMI